MFLRALLSLGPLIIAVSGTGHITPLYKVNNTACIAENLRLTDRYVCDALGNIICIGGWSEPSKLCSVPVCNMDGVGCVNGKCIFPNVCACEVGWDGPNCNECIPLAGCRHGTCNKALECNCNPGWTGGQCSEAICHGCINGCCHEPNKCLCDFGWKGHNCTECTTLSNCKNGRCLTHPFQCECFDGWSGIDCTKPVCRASCHPQNGFCHEPEECICRNGWGGRNCETCVPYPGCKGNCVNNVPWTCSDTEMPDSVTPDEWNTWSQWSACSKTCGDGNQERTRICPSKGHIVGNCPGSSSETRKCSIDNCKIDGKWADWTVWSKCNKSCGTGERFRHRSCSNPIPKFGGKNCTGEDTEVSKCMISPCPIDGRWSVWTSWGRCSATCGIGEIKRTRACDSPAPSHGGLNCQGHHTQTSSCNLKECPIDGIWSLWSQWSDCSRTCGEGIQERIRNCEPPLFGGRPCSGNSTTERDVIPCWKQVICAIDGGWSSWGAWSECSHSCGGGTRVQRRECDNPVPQFGGLRCTGHAMNIGKCNQDINCPIDGKWNNWRSWSICSASCNGGSQVRERTCIPPKFGGKECIGESNQSIRCNMIACPVDGKWNAWGAWTTCSATCDEGSQRRNRNCTLPLFGGKSCSGKSTENRECKVTDCPIDGKWGSWDAWSTCSVSCKGGTQKRERTCIAPLFGGRVCLGETSESRECNTQACPIDGKWDSWGAWSTCSATCFGGTRIRERTCIAPLFGGRVCFGEASQREECNTNACSDDGNWNSWGEWSTCSASCNGGTQERERTCISGESACHGDSSESRECNTRACSVDEIWTQWGQWSICSLSCGNGQQTRTRFCETNHCSGDSLERNSCNLGPCPNINVWSEWGHWGICSHSCGGGERTRARSCPTGTCLGEALERHVCNNSPCGVSGNWGTWEEWSSCSATCGEGQRTRARLCNSRNRQDCIGNGLEVENCIANACDNIDGNWSNWENWSECSVTCGSGNQIRQRHCNDPAPLNNGKFCVGTMLQSQMCILPNCPNGEPPLDGGFTEWGEWSPCTVDCKGDKGDQVRRRHCSNPRPIFGENSCVGDVKEKRECTGSIPKQESDPTGMCFYIGA